MYYDSLEKQNQWEIYIWREKKISHKKLTHVIIKAGKSKITIADVQIETEGLQASVEPDRANVPVGRFSGRRILSYLGEVHPY